MNAFYRILPLLLSATVTSGVAFYSHRHPDSLLKWFVYGAYFMVGAVFLIWMGVVLNLAWSRRERIKELSRKHWKGGVFVVLVASAIHLSVPPEFRVLADEANLLGISRSMTFDRRVDKAAEAVWSDGKFQPVRWLVDKRPLLFPFCAHLLHTATGFRPQNVFVLNFLVLTALLGLVWLVTCRCWGGLWAVAAVLLVGSENLLSQSAGSGGFELLNTFFMFASACALWWYLKQPCAERFLLLWAHLQMFMHCRYESTALVAATLVLLMAFRTFKVEHLGQGRRTLFYVSAPPLMLPLFWAHFATSNPWELNKGEAVSIFSLGDAATHTSEFFKTFFSFNLLYPHTSVVNMLGLAGLSILAVRFAFFRHVSGSALRTALWIMGSNMVILWIIITSYFQGSVLNVEGTGAEPTQTRFYLPFVLLLPWGCLWLLRSLPWLRVRPVQVLPAVLAAVAVYHPVSMESRLSRQLTLPREYRMVTAYFDALPTRNFIVIYHRSGMLTARTMASISFNRANKNPTRWLELKRKRRFETLYVVQRIAHKDLQPMEGMTLDPALELKMVKEYRATSKYLIRISKVGELLNE